MVRVRIQAGRLQNVSSVEGQPSTDEYPNPSDFRNKGGVEKNMLRWVRQANGIGKKPDDFAQKNEEDSPEDQNKKTKDDGQKYFRDINVLSCPKIKTQGIHLITR